jgi:hypothetical protein
MGNVKNAYNILVGKYDGKTSLRKSRRRSEDNIKTDLKVIGREDVDWIQLAKNAVNWWAVVNTVMKLRILYEAGNLTS